MDSLCWISGVSGNVPAHGGQAQPTTLLLCVLHFCFALPHLWPLSRQLPMTPSFSVPILKKFRAIVSTKKHTHSFVLSHYLSIHDRVDLVLLDL